MPDLKAIKRFLKRGGKISNIPALPFHVQDELQRFNSGYRRKRKAKNKMAAASRRKNRGSK